MWEVSIFGGPECLLVPAGEPEKDSRFLAEPPDILSGVPTAPNGLGNRAFALADSVGVM